LSRRRLHYPENIVSLLFELEQPTEILDELPEAAVNLLHPRHSSHEVALKGGLLKHRNGSEKALARLYAANPAPWGVF